MRITVVGGGIIGLSAALRLAQAGHSVSVVTAQGPQHTTSSVAGAIWYPYRVHPEPEVTRWASVGYRVLADLAVDRASGVAVHNGRELFRRPRPDPPWRAAVDRFARVTTDRLPEGYVDGYELPVPVVDMPVHLRWLVDQLARVGVELEVRRLDTIGDAFAGADAVINCSGLGARDLVGDRRLVAVRGQVVVVEQFGLEEWWLDQTDPRNLIYLVPRAGVVTVGGTADEADETSAADPATSAAILRRAARLVPEIATARIVAEHVGLRPARPAVRLQTDLSGAVAVIHCYGHGGAGVTLAYGCAEDIVEHVARVGP